METPQPSPEDLLKQILSTLQSVQHDHQKLSAVVQGIQRHLEAGTEPKGSHQPFTESHQHAPSVERIIERKGEDSVTASPAIHPSASPSLLSLDGKRDSLTNGKLASPQHGAASTLSSRIILTTYPGQSGIDPITMIWGHPDPAKRGPVVVSRSRSTIRRRNGTQIFTYHAYRFAPLKPGSDLTSI